MQKRQESGSRARLGRLLVVVVAGSFGCGQTAAPPCSIPSVETLSAGLGDTCGVKSDGSVACWGAGVSLMPPSVTFTQVSAGISHTCAIRSDGALECWGSDAHFEAPRVWTPKSGRFVMVTANANRTCALRNDGIVEARNGGVLVARTAPANLSGGTLTGGTYRVYENSTVQWEQALGAYNAGPAAVDQAGGIPNIPETREYVKAILDRIAITRIDPPSIPMPKPIESYNRPASPSRPPLRR